MAEKLDDSKVRMGTVIAVRNLERGRFESEKYFALKVEDSDGGHEHWLLFTGHELSLFTLFTVEKLTDNLKEGRMYAISGRKGVQSYLTRISCGGEEQVVRIPAHLHAVAMKRAEENPEDIPSQSFLSDLMD